MSDFLQRVQNEIQQRGLFSRGQKIIGAVSGGADSMVLLHALQALAAKNRWQIVVAHFNHQLRGRASAADEKLVQRVAQELKLPFFVARADVKKFAAQSKLSIEMAARKLRHEFFAHVACEQKKSAIALAHQADDQVELFFLRLLRGAGGEGLAGMKWRSRSPADGASWLARPLLGFSKMEILEFARQNKIQFRQDPSNFSNDFLRNQIRNELLPLLKKNYQPGLTKTVLRLMEIVGAESEFVGAAARAGTGDFDDLPRAVQRKFLQQQLVGAGVVPDFELIEQLRAAAGKFVSVGLDFSVARDQAGKITGRRSSAVEIFKTDEVKVSVKAGQANFGGKKFGWVIKKFGGVRGRSLRLSQEFFDADKVGGEIILRHWRAGDRFQPIGLHSSAKLQDLFVNAKISAARRRNLVLATTSAGDIFWVEGLRLGESFKLTPSTGRQFVWEWSNLAA